MSSDGAIDLAPNQSDGQPEPSDGMDIPSKKYLSGLNVHDMFSPLRKQAQLIQVIATVRQLAKKRQCGSFGPWGWWR